MSQLEQLVLEAKKNGATFYQNAYDGALYAIDPPECLFGFTYHAHQIPPFAPGSTLILGYGQGMVANLMRKIWGAGLKITGVDLEEYPYTFTEYKLYKRDAKEYVWDCTNSIIKTRYDYIAIDVWDGKKVPDFVFEVEFVVRLREMCKRMVCLNITMDDVKRTKAYFDYGFKFERAVPLEGNEIMWWSVEEK